MRKHIISSLLMLICLMANAQEFEQGGISYNITSTNNLTVEVTRKTQGTYSGKVIIPQTVTYQSRTLTVTRIGNSAFESCTNLTAVELPSTINTIGYDAFSGCTKLKELSLPEAVTSIKERAFCECINLKNITIANPLPDALPYNAFSKVQYLGTLHVPGGCKAIYQAVDFWSYFAEIEDTTLDEPVLPTPMPEPKNKKEKKEVKAFNKKQIMVKANTGDTPKSIAKKYYVKQKKLKRFNKITGDSFKPGQIIRLR